MLILSWQQQKKENLIKKLDRLLLIPVCQVLLYSFNVLKYINFFKVLTSFINTQPTTSSKKFSKKSGINSCQISVKHDWFKFIK